MPEFRPPRFMGGGGGRRFRALNVLAATRSRYGKAETAEFCGLSCSIMDVIRQTLFRMPCVRRAVGCEMSGCGCVRGRHPV